MTRTAAIEQSIASISAGTADRRALLRDRAEGLAREVDWAHLAETLETRRLLGTLGPRIIELSGNPDPGFVEAVESVIEASRRRSVFLELTSERILTLLAAAGVRAATLKGPSLAASIYGDSGRRQSNDIDLLIAPDRLKDAVSTVMDLGYRSPDDFVTADGLPLLHLTMFHETGILPPVELHWRIHWYEREFSTDRLLPPDPVAPGAWEPTRIDQLASLLLFYARDGFVGLRLATDLGAWWDAYGEQVTPAELGETVRRYPGLGRAIPAAAEAGRRVVGLPEALRSGSTGALDARQRLAVRLANPNPRPDRAEIYATAGLIDGLLAPPGGAGAFVRRQIFPPREVLEQQARHGDRERRRSRFVRAAGIVGRYALALIKVTPPRPRRGTASAAAGR